MVGLPRTGTTLVERILAAHSAVVSLGEPPLFPLAFATASGAPTNVPLGAAAIEASARRRLERDGCDRYRREIAGLADAAGIVVDKLPFNSLLAGPIRLALPEARIVLIEREPMDALWSAHRNPFALGGWYGWSRRQSDLAAHAAHHRRLMDHWGSALGEAMTVVRYEDLVSDPKFTIERLLAFSGLPPEAPCFEPHKAPGAVTTLSQAAVRVPIGKRFIGAWRPMPIGCNRCATPCRGKRSSAPAPPVHLRRRTRDRGRGGIGRRAGLKIRFRKECRFDPDRPHQLSAS